MIKFEVDYKELDNAISQLEKTGKLDSKVAGTFSQASKAINTTASDTKGLISQFKQVSSTAIKMGKSVEDAFGQGIQDGLKEAGVSMDEFSAALTKANTPTKTLKQELKELKEALAQAKVNGKDVGAEFEAMRARAGALSDAIGDANREIKNAGSDTRHLDNVVGSISALAGGFAAAQGAAALFGSEDENLQKTLVKVTGAMALAQGVQQFYNATLKEGSLAKLADTIQTGAQSAAMTVYTFVTNGATVATKLLRGALVATGIGAVVVLIASLAGAFSDMGDEEKTAKEITDDLTEAFERQSKAVEDLNKLIDFNTKIRLEKLKQAGASEKKLNEVEGLSRLKQIANLRDNEKKAFEARQNAVKDFQDKFNKKFEEGKKLGITLSLSDKEKKEVIESYNKLNDNILTATQKRVDAENEFALSQEEFKTKQREDELKKTDKHNKEKLKKQKLFFVDSVKEEVDGIAVLRQVNKDTRDAEEAAAFKKLEENAKTLQDQKDFAQFQRDQADLDFVKEVEDADARNKKREADAEKARQQRIKDIEQIVQITSQIGNLFAQLGQQQTDIDNKRIAGQRAALDGQLKAGAISQKEFEARAKQIDTIERQAKQRAAQREKQAAVFQAVLAIPLAFLKALPNVPLAILSAALAAAQAAIIASKPVPRFFRGKRDSYEGPGMVADMGSEIVERRGRMFLYTKPTHTYLGAADKVYTAAQTRAIMHNSDTGRLHIMQPRGEKFDYDRMGKAIPKNSININIDKDFITESVANGLQKTQYMDRRYSSR